MQYRFLILGHGSVIVTYILRSLLNTHLAPVNILCHRFCFPSNVFPPLTLLRQNSQCTCIQWPLAALSGFIILYPLHFLNCSNKFCSTFAILFWYCFIFPLLDAFYYCYFVLLWLWFATDSFVQLFGQLWYFMKKLENLIWLITVLKICAQNTFWSKSEDMMLKYYFCQS